MSSFREALLNLAALNPPKGMQSNFDNPPGRPGMTWGIIVPCLFVTTLMTALRAYVKTFIARKWDPEDYLIVVAFLFSVAEYAACIHGGSYAPVIHQWDMTIRTVSKYLLDFHVGAIFYDATILVLKVAILLQFLRIFVPMGERNKTWWCTMVMLYANTIFYTVTIFIEIFACKPMRKQWDPLITRGKCVNTASAYLTSQSFNCALDLIILFWTQTIIWSLHMSLHQKLKLGVLFIAGLIACIFGACSVWINVNLLRDTDQAYWAGWMALFTFPETTAGFLILGLPVVPKFIKHTQSKLFPSTVKSNQGPPSGRGRTFEEGRRAGDSGGKRTPPRSWWHISAASKLSSLASKLTGTTITRNGSQRNSKTLKSRGGDGNDKMDLGFLTFNQDRDLDLRFDQELRDQAHVRNSGGTGHGQVYVYGDGDDRIYRQGSGYEMDEFVKTPKHAHSHV